MDLTQPANLGEFMGGIVAGKHNTASHSSAELSISLQRCRVHVSTGGGTSEQPWGSDLKEYGGRREGRADRP